MGHKTRDARTRQFWYLRTARHHHQKSFAILGPHLSQKIFKNSHTLVPKNQKFSHRRVDPCTRLFIAAIVGARISMGLFFNVTGPTLPTLAANCGTTVKTLSWIFTVRAVAQFIGAATATKIFKILNPLIAVTISVFGIGICLIFIPVVVDFWLLCILVRFLITRAGLSGLASSLSLRVKMYENFWNILKHFKKSDIFTRNPSLDAISGRRYNMPPNK